MSMGKTKKVPSRTCCTCGKQGDKREFLRLVRTPSGVVKFDETGKEAGRGAYICKSSDCFNKAMKQGRLGRALRISLDNDDYSRLEKDFESLMNEGPSGEGMVD